MRGSASSDLDPEPPEAPRIRHIARMSFTEIAEFQTAVALMRNMLTLEKDGVRKGTDTLKIVVEMIEMTELLAFDLATCLYLIDSGNKSNLRDVIQYCLAMRENEPRFSLDNPSSVEKYLTRLYKIIAELHTFVHRCRLNDADFQSTCSDLMGQIETAIVAVDNALGIQKHETVEDEGLPHCDLSRYVHVDYEEASLKFAEFMSVNVIQDQVRTSEVMELTNKIAFRLTVMHHLQEYITIMRDVASSNEYTAVDSRYLTEAFVNSPHVKVLEDCCQFLKCMLTVGDIRRVEMKMSDTSTALKLALDRYCARSSVLHGRICSEIDDMKESIARQEQANDALRGSMKSSMEYTSALFSGEIESDVHVDELLTSVDEFEKQHGDQRPSMKLLRKVIEEGSNRYNEGIVGFRQLARADKALLDYRVAAFCGNGAQEQLQLESERLSEYEDRLKKCIARLEYPDVDCIIPEARELCDALREYDARRCSIENRVDALISSDVADVMNAIDMKTAEIGRAKRTLAECDEELSELEAKLLRLREKKQAMRTTGSVYSTETMNSMFESNFKALKDKIVCPCCSTRNRDRLVVTCGHSLCHVCIDSCEVRRTCPICMRGYASGAVRRFLC